MPFDLTSPHLSYMISILDVAREASCSPSLVSKVLRNRMGKSSARPETIARIHETAKRLGYTPNPTARALVQGKRGAIAILIPEFYGQPSSGLDSKLLITIAKDLNIRNERLMLQFYWTIDDLKDALKASNPASVDGIISVLTPSSGNPPLAEILSTVKIPIVTINTQPVADTIPNVGLDQISVGYCATKHLLDCGCKAPLFIACTDNETKMRFKGFKAALQEAGLPFSPSHYWNIQLYRQEILIRNIVESINGKFDWDSIVTPSDSIAFTAIQTLQTHGFRIPDDIQIVGIDNSPICNYAIPHISSVSGCDDERAMIAIRELHNLMNGEKAENHIIEPKVMVRQSTRPLATD